MSDDPHRSEREFLKLIIGLDTGVIGALFYSQERFVQSEWTILFYAGALMAFATSFGLALWASRLLIDMEKRSDETHHFNIRLWYDRTLSYTMTFFGNGALSTIILFLLIFSHLKHK